MITLYKNVIRTHRFYSHDNHNHFRFTVDVFSHTLKVFNYSFLPWKCESVGSYLDERSPQPWPLNRPVSSHGEAQHSEQDSVSLNLLKTDANPLMNEVPVLEQNMCTVEVVIERGFTINGTARGWGGRDQLQLGFCNTLWLINIPIIDQRADSWVSWTRGAVCLHAANVIDPTGSTNKAQDLPWLLHEDKIADLAFTLIVIFMQISNNNIWWHAAVLYANAKHEGCGRSTLLSNPEISSWSRYF